MNRIKSKVISMIVMAAIIGTVLPVQAWAGTAHEHGIVKSVYSDFYPETSRCNPVVLGEAYPGLGIVSLNQRDDTAVDWMYTKYCGKGYQGKAENFVLYGTVINTRPDVAIAKVSQDENRRGDACLKIDFERGSNLGSTLIQIRYTVKEMEIESGRMEGQDKEYDVSGNLYYLVKNTENPSEKTAEAPDERTLEKLLRDAVKIECINDHGHRDKMYDLMEHSYTVSRVRDNFCLVRVDSEKYIEQYCRDMDCRHILAENVPSERMIILEYENGKWQTTEFFTPLKFKVLCREENWNGCQVDYRIRFDENAPGKKRPGIVKEKIRDNRTYEEGDKVYLKYPDKLWVYDEENEGIWIFKGWKDEQGRILPGFINNIQENIKVTGEWMFLEKDDLVCQGKKWDKHFDFERWNDVCHKNGCDFETWAEQSAGFYKDWYGWCQDHGMSWSCWEENWQDIWKR